MKKIFNNMVWTTCTLVALLFFAWGCAGPEVEVPKDDEELEVEPGTTLVSGEPLCASLNGGLAPFALGGNLSHKVLGTDVVAEGNLLPDLFVEGVGGLANSGLHRATFVKMTESGNPVYAVGGKVTKYPWNSSSAPQKIAPVGELGTYAFAYHNGKLSVAKYNVADNSFGTEWVATTSVEGLPATAVGLEVVGVEGSTLTLALLGLTVVAETPSDDDVSLSYYNTLGTYRGKISVGRLYTLSLNTSSWTPLGVATRVSDDKLIIAPSAVYRAGSEGGLMVANEFGAMKAVSAQGVVSQPLDECGRELKNRSTVAAVCSVPDGGFVTSGEGSMWYYAPSEDGFVSREVLMEGGVLYAGSMVVPNVVDWDGDGRYDIVAGNSAGNLLFFKNYGTNDSPAFGVGEYLRSAGEVVEIRAGYYSLGGPMESGWGYLCPTVVDWNGDGVQDVVYSFNEGILEVMLGERRGGEVQLGGRQKIMRDYMEICGMWRTRPAVATVGGRTILVAMDQQDEIHVYERRVGNAVVDRGEATLYYSDHITGYRQQVDSSLAERGREKLHLVDWDEDGDVDLLVGAPITASFPSPVKGLPYSRFPTKGLNVLYFENIGSNVNISFAHPKQLLFKGKDFNIGTASISPTFCPLGEGGLLVGCDCGQMYYFSKNDLVRTISLW